MARQYSFVGQIEVLVVYGRLKLGRLSYLLTCTSLAAV